VLDEVVVVVDVAISPERAGTFTTPYGRQYCAGRRVGYAAWLYGAALCPITAKKKTQSECC
jgi:hypothetical protein